MALLRCAVSARLKGDVIDKVAQILSRTAWRYYDGRRVKSAVIEVVCVTAGKAKMKDGWHYEL